MCHKTHLEKFPQKGSARPHQQLLLPQDDLKFSCSFVFHEKCLRLMTFPVSTFKLAGKVLQTKAGGCNSGTKKHFQGFPVRVTGC